MRMSKFEAIQKRRLAGFAAVILLALGGAAVFTAGAQLPPPAGMGGPWVNAASSYDCQQESAGTICAEWPNALNNTVTVCCIPEALVGTNQGFPLNDCDVYLTTRAID